MLWQYIFISISAVIFFGFVAFCWAKFGLESCYSAYGPHWAKTPPFSWSFNPWSLVTGFTAAILIPVMLTASEGSAWQFTGFLCPVLLLFVALTPDYGKDKMAHIVHMVSASASALFSILYILFVAPHLWWLIVVYVVAATVCTFIFGKWSWNFWFEMAAYLGIYTTIFMIIGK